jgi:O-antigen/teichoic acid export membrane protein
MKLARAGLTLGLSTAARMAANFVVLKMIALHLGTDGMGYLGQFMSVVALTTAFAGGGIAMGVTKYVAQQESRDQSTIPHLRAAIAI